MKYVWLIFLAAIIPQLAVAQEASLPWFTDADIANSIACGSPSATLPEAEGTADKGVLLTQSVGFDAKLIQQSRGMISFWLKPNWNGDDGLTHKILRMGDPDTNGILIEKSNQGLLRFVMTGSGKTSAARFDVSDWQSGKWHHIAVSWKNGNTLNQPLGIALWIDKVCVDSCIFTGNAFMNPSIMTDKNVYIGDTSSNAIMDELIIRKQLTSSNPNCPGQLELVYRDYFRTAPYTDIRITHEPNRVRSDKRVVNGCAKQFGLQALKEGQWEDITNFEVRAYWNWSNFDAKPFISWSTTNTSVASVQGNGLVNGRSLGNCNLIASFRGMTDTYNIEVISSNQPDLDLMYVERLPRYLRNATKNWPSEGETVQSVVHVGNFGYQDVPAGSVVKFELIADTNNNFIADEDEPAFDTRTSVINQKLTPGQSVTVSFSWTWTMSPVFVRVTLDPDNTLAEVCEANNQRCELNIARAYHWGYNEQWFRDDHLNKKINLVGSFSDYDWCNAEVDRMVLVMRESVYPTTSPVGIKDSIRVDNFQKRLYGTWEDETWVKEADYYDGGFPDMEPQNSTVMDIDPAIGHEIGHTTIWLPDLYGHPHFISNVFLKDEQGNPYAGTKLYPAVNNGGTAMLNSGTYHYTDHLGLGYSPLMDYCHLWLHPANAGFSNHMAQSRSGLVDHFGYHVPSQNAIQVFDVNDQPLTGAAVYMYQMINTGLPHTVGGKYMPDRPKFIGNTDANGKYEIPNITHATWDDWETDNVEGAIHITNPFGRSATDRAWGPSWTVGEYLLIKIVSEGNVEFRFLTLTDLNEAFYSGKTGQATHKIRTNLPPSSSFTPAVPPVIPDEIKVTNLAPVIVVPQDIKVNQGGELVIDASNSFDPEGQPLIFRWFGPTEATGPVLRTTAPTSLGDYVYWLLVIDGYRWSHVEVKVKVVANTLVYGKVTDASGKPVPYAVVGIKQGHYATADAKHYAVADADGNYKLQFVDPGTYYLAPWKDGFAPGSDRAVTVVANQSVKQDLLLTTLAGKNLIQGTQLVSASTSEGGYTPSKAVDGDRITAWQTPYWPEDPSFFYVSLGTPRDISGITIYRFYEENSWGNYSDNYSIDVMTAGDPLNPASWENNPNVQTVYSAERSTHGYPISQNLAADPIGIKLNGVLGIRLRFEDNRWPDMYDIRELVVHSTTDFSGLAYGTVKDTSGNLVPEAVVQVGGPTSNILLITDATGSWSFPLDPGSYQLYADAPGHVGRLISFQVPGDGTPYSKDIILPAKSEPGLYNGDFEIASIQDDRKPDGWELFIQTGGNSDMYRYGRATYDNTTPGGSACGYLQVGTRNQSLPYWKEGWMKPLNTHWIPVNPNSTYNFYFKAKKTGYAASFWRLVWRRANGSEIRSVISPGWYWIPPDNWSRVFEGDFSGKKPMVRMTPPTGAAWAEIHIGFTDWPSDDVGRGGTTFVDDIIIDEFQSSSTEVAKISDLRQIPDGQSVIIRSRQITALPGCGIPENTAYIEELDRSSGIRIDLSELNNWSAQTGDTVTITGFLATSQDGERFILATDMQQAAATDRIKPVIMTNKAAGGSTIGLQSGVWDGWFVENPDGTREYKSQEAAGLNPIGLLVKISGKVSQIDPNGAYFYIDDGARVDDGTYTGGDWNYGIRIALDGRNYTKGKFLTITGVVSCFRHTDGKLRRLIRPVLVEQEQ